MQPVSLWLDDLWVASLVKYASARDLIRLHAPAPIGFVAILKLIRFCFGDGHLQLQALGFTARLLTIGGVAWLATELTRSFGLGLIAAAGMALQSELALQSVRIKQYALDAWISVGLLVLALRFLRRPSCARLLPLAAASLVALPISFPSAFVGPVLLSLCALSFAIEQHRDAPREVARVLAITALCDVIGAALLFAIVRQKATPALQDYWSANYVSIASLRAFRRFFRHGAGWNFLFDAFGPLPWLGLLEFVGVWMLLRRRWTRPLGVFMLLLYPALICSSALRMYPIGEPRVDSFLRPIIVLVCVLALQPLAAWRFGAGTLASLATLFAIGQLEQSPVWYVAAGEKPLAAEINAQLADPQVGLLLFPWANWAFAYYGHWPVRLVPVSDSTNGFFAIPQRPNTWVLPETYQGHFFSNYTRDRHAFDALIAPLMAAGPRTLVFYGSYGSAGDYRALLRNLKRRGYAVTSRQSQDGAIAVRLERR
jgi:hypothetical protein